MDNLDLTTATDEFRKSCIALNEELKKELEAREYLMEKERVVRIKCWEKLLTGELKKGIYDEAIKNETFDEKILFEKAKLTRKMAENRKDSLREKLYSLKKQYNVQ